MGQRPVTAVHFRVAATVSISSGLVTTNTQPEHPVPTMRLRFDKLLATGATGGLRNRTKAAAASSILTCTVPSRILCPMSASLDSMLFAQSNWTGQGNATTHTIPCFETIIRSLVAFFSQKQFSKFDQTSDLKNRFRADVSVEQLEVNGHSDLRGEYRRRHGNNFGNGEDV